MKDRDDEAAKPRERIYLFRKEIKMIGGPVAMTNGKAVMNGLRQVCFRLIHGIRKRCVFCKVSSDG